MQNDKVSVIMPAYNCEKYIAEAIQSVQAQTYTNWELLIVDDCSTDKTKGIIDRYAENDNRIVYLKNKINSGAAASRNKAVEKATGRYIAFLDSDDVWLSEKLEKQLKYMNENGYSFTCTSYQKIDTEGHPLNEVKYAFDADYKGLLRRCPGNSTVIYNAEILGKYEVPLIRKRNDYVMWLAVIKKAGVLHGFDEIMSYYRVGMQSISSNKMSLVKYHWVVYRKIERLSLLKSAYLVLYWVIRGIFISIPKLNKSSAKGLRS